MSEFINEQLASDEFQVGLIDRVSDADGTLPIEPMRLLANLASTGALTADERDAGEILHKMGKAASSPLKRPQHVNWRDKDGKWTMVSKPALGIKAMVDEAIGFIRNERRVRAVRLALLSDEPRANVDRTSSLVAGIEDVTRGWWGEKARAVVMSGNVSLPKISFGDEREAEAVANDNDPEAARRIVEGFERMHARGQIDPNERMNEDLYAAGLRYQTEHHLAGLSPLGAIDYTRDQVDFGSGSGDHVGGIFSSERAIRALESFRAARRAIGPRYAAVVDAVVIDGKTLAVAGSEGTKYTAGARAEAAASERLNAGLRLLAIHYGIMTKRQAA